MTPISKLEKRKNSIKTKASCWANFHWFSFCEGNRWCCALTCIYANNPLYRRFLHRQHLVYDRETLWDPRDFHLRDLRANCRILLWHYRATHGLDQKILDMNAIYPFYAELFTIFRALKLSLTEWCDITMRIDALWRLPLHLWIFFSLKRSSDHFWFVFGLSIFL